MTTPDYGPLTGWRREQWIALIEFCAFNQNNPQEPVDESFERGFDCALQMIIDYAAAVVKG